MNYKKHYDLLIERAKHRTLEGYTEKHHIVPRCLGGTDEKENLISLTAKEHFIAHLLLVKIYPHDKKMILAVNFMLCNGDYQQRITGRIYGWLRERFSEYMSEYQGGKNNSQYGTKWIYNLQLRQSKKIPKTQLIPEGWELGRVVDFVSFEKREKEKKKKRIQALNKKQARIDKRTEYAKEIFDLYKRHNFQSLSDFCKSGYYDKSIESLSKLFQRYIPEYVKTQGRAYT